MLPPRGLVLSSSARVTCHLSDSGCAQEQGLTRNMVDQDAQAADQKKVPAEVIIQVASYEINTDSDQDESIVATSGSKRSESAGESEQNDPPSSLTSTTKQYERMQACAALSRDFKDQGLYRVFFFAPCC